MNTVDSPASHSLVLAELALALHELGLKVTCEREIETSMFPSLLKLAEMSAVCVLHRRTRGPIAVQAMIDDLIFKLEWIGFTVQRRASDAEGFAPGTSEGNKALMRQASDAHLMEMIDSFADRLPVKREGARLTAHGRSWLDEAGVRHTIHLVLTNLGEDIPAIREFVPTLEASLLDGLRKL